jgi:hypothetical protein
MTGAIDSAGASVWKDHTSGVCGLQGGVAADKEANATTVRSCRRTEKRYIGQLQFVTQGHVLQAPTASGLQNDLHDHNSIGLGTVLCLLLHLPQEVIHLLSLAVCFSRAGTFLIRDSIEGLHPALVKLMMLDLPGKQTGGNRHDADEVRGWHVQVDCCRGARIHQGLSTPP